MKLPKLKLPAFVTKLAPSPERVRRSWIKWLVYPAFFVLALWIALYLTFPGDALRDRVEVEARNRLGMEVQIGSASLAGLTGITLRNVSWLPNDATPPPSSTGGEEAAVAEGETAAAPVPVVDHRVVLDRVTVKARVLSLLRGKQAFTFDIDAWGGNAEGRYEAASDGSFSVQAKLAGLDLAKAPLRPLAGIDLAGRLDKADIVLTSTGKDLTKASGNLVLKGDELQLKGGEVQGFTLPAMALGTLDGHVIIDNGKASFETFQLKGQDLEAAIDGSVRLGTKVATSTLSGRLKLKPSDEWWSKNEGLKSMADFALPVGKDGWRTVSLYGQLGKPAFRPQR